MLFINNVNLNQLAETVVPNDTRKTADWRRIPNKEFIVPAGDNYFYNSVFTGDFTTNDVPFVFATIGCRPTFNHKIWESNTPTAELYLIKFNNKVLALCSSNLNIDTNVSAATPEVIKIIGTAAQDLQYVFVEMVGAGGGGSGGSAWIAGAGGASGSHIIMCLKVKHNADIINTTNSTKFQIGQGGDTTKNLGKAGNGAATGNWNKEQKFGYWANGGDGANKDTAATAWDPVASEIPYIHYVHVTKGWNGGWSNNITRPEEVYNYSPDGNSLKTVASTTIVHKGAPGAPSARGKGGDGAFDQGSAPKPGESIIEDEETITGPGPGGGGGGGSYKVADTTFGSPGGNGYLAIYY